MTQSAKWITVITMTALFPVLLTLLYHPIGTSVNTLCMAAPIAATLFFGFKVGILFSILNWLESVIILSQHIPRSVGMIRIFIPFTVTIVLCFGADKLRLYLLERKKAEKALRESEERYRMIFHHSADGIILLDNQGVIVDASPSVPRHVGYNAEELLGKSFTELGFFAEPAQYKIAEMIRGNATSLTDELETLGYNKDGGRIYLGLTISRIAKPSTSAQWICLIKNTTERKEMMDKLQEAQKMKAIGRLAGGIAHDINNILNAIIGSAHAQRHELGAINERGCFEDLDIITSACNRGAQLTRNLLGFARKSNVTKEVFSVNTAVERVLSLVKRTCLKHIRYETHLADPLPMIQGDQNQIETALMNICLNAQDAMSPNGLLTVSTFKKGSSVWIQIADSGCGMDEQTLERVFEPFFTTKPVGKGTGLGLSMAYGVVKSNDGTIVLDSSLGKGTTVTISFPEAPPDARPKPDSRPAPKSDELLNLLRSRTVLLVDDEPLVLRSGARMLQTLGCTVISASGGREALEIFKERKNDISLVILDLIMPDMNGTETLEKLREIDGTLPILLASGYTQETDRVNALQETPACSFLQKPYQPDALLAAVRNILRERAA